MTRRNASPSPAVAANAGRVLAALAVSRLPSQVDRETLVDAVALDDLLDDRVLPVSWRILADQYQAADEAAAQAAEDEAPSLLDEVTE